MDEVRLHKDYCLTHDAQDHWLTRDGQCYGETRTAIETNTRFYYARHDGRTGEFVYRERKETTMKTKTEKPMNTGKMIARAQSRANKTGEPNALATPSRPLTKIEQATAARKAKQAEEKAAKKAEQAKQNFHADKEQAKGVDGFSECWALVDGKTDTYDAYVSDLWNNDELLASGYIVLGKGATIDLRQMTRVTKDGVTDRWEGKTNVNWIDHPITLIVHNHE